MTDNLNDNLPLARDLPEPDAHGQAAYLLTESLIHTLVEQTVITREAAIEAVDVAAEVRADVNYDFGDMPGARLRSLALLEGLSKTLRVDQAV